MMKSDSKRVVIVGAGGRLGCSLEEMLRHEHQVTAFGHEELDLGSEASIERALANLEYDALFLTGALTAVDYCEDHQDEAMAVNGSGPGRVAEISAAKGAHVTFISTDFVFDGKKAGLYVETDVPNPISVYGASKLEGERQVLAANEGNLVARVSWVFGPGKPAFPEWVIDKACHETELTLPADKVCCPTYTVDLVEWLRALVLDRPGGPASGILHLCNSGPCTWRDWGQFCIDTARMAGLPIEAGEIKGVPLDSVSAFAAKRPRNSAMSTAKFSALTNIRPRGWKAAVRDFVIQANAFEKYKAEWRAP